MSTPLKIFITYSHKNRAEKDELKISLSVMEQKKAIKIWHDNEMLPGDKWRKKITNKLNESDILLYLASVDSLSFENCNSELIQALENCNSELIQALKETQKLYLASVDSLDFENCNLELIQELQKAKKRIIPIILEECNWERHELSKFQVRSSYDKPINEWSTNKDGWQKVVDGIQKIVEEMLKPKIKTLTKYEKRIAEEAEEWDEGSLLIFRGQSNEAWGLKSAAHRRIENNEKRRLENTAHRQTKKTGRPIDMITYLTEKLIVPARNEGYGCQQNGKLNDLELLAALQHQEAATCLIDFTANFHIALWFACEEPKQDGAVFIINRSDVQTFKEVTPKRAKKGIEKLLRKKVTDISESTDGRTSKNCADTNTKVYYWKPPPNENRIIAQHSCFIFSEKTISKSAYKKIDISKEDKEAIRELLKRYYGLKTRSIFRDITGFASSHGQNKPISPSTSERYLLSGDTHLRKGKFDKAIKDYERAIKLNLDYAKAYERRALAYFKKDDYDQAIADYGRVIELEPNYAEIYNYRGNAYQNKDNYDQAIVDYDDAIKLKPDYAGAYNNRGFAYQNKGEYDQAIEDYDNAIKHDSHYALAYKNRGFAYYNNKKYDLAIKDYDKAIDLKLDYAKAHYNRGLAYSKKGNYNKAIEDYNKAIDLKPDYIEAYVSRGRVYGDKDEDDRAIASYKKVIEIKPCHAEAYANHIIACLHLKRWEQARKDLQTAQDKGFDIIASFHNAFENVADFERRAKIKLPPDIAAMLSK